MHPRVATMPLDKALKVSTTERPLNKHYQSDMMQTVQYLRLFLGLLGVWPMLSRDLSTAKKYMFTLLIVLSLILLSFIIIPPLVHIILIEKNTSLRIIMFGPISFHLSNFFKYGFFLLHLKTIRRCVEHVTMDWKSIVSEGDQAIMKRNAKVGRSLTLISCVFLWSSGICYYTIAPIVQGETINEFNETVKQLAYPGFDIFFDYQSRANYDIISITICASAFVSLNVMSASCSFTAGVVSHACGLLQIVISQLETLVDSVENDKNENQLQNRQFRITQCHIRVLRLSSGIEEVIREICFMELISWTMILCTDEYYLLTAWGDNEAISIITYAVGCCTSSFNVWLFCYIGELLKEQILRMTLTYCNILRALTA